LRGGLLLLASHGKSGDGKECDDQCFIFHNGDFRCVFGLLLCLLIWRNYVAGWFFAMGCNPTAARGLVQPGLIKLAGIEERTGHPPQIQLV
jgi:hypothetical protein